MMLFRPMISNMRLTTLAGVVIGCCVAVSATSQGLNVSQRSKPAPAIAMAPPSLAARVADPSQITAFPIVATQPADGPTLQALIQSINPLWAIPVASFSAIRERPVFSPSRRPPVSANAASVEPARLALANPRPPFALIGAVAGEGDGIGIFLDPATKNVVRLKTQESHLGWTLNAVKGREATLQRGGEIVVLEIPNP
jgi:general secretion pathway protein N